MSSFLRRTSLTESVFIFMVALYGISSAVVLGLVNNSITGLSSAASMGGPVFFPTTAKNGTTIWKQNYMQNVPEDLRMGPTWNVFTSGILGILGSLAMIALVLLRPNLRNDRINVTRKFGIPAASILVSITLFLLGHVLITTIILWKEHSASSIFDPSFTDLLPGGTYPASKGRFDPEAWNCQLAFYQGDDPQYAFLKAEYAQEPLCREERALRIIMIPFTVLAALVSVYVVLIRRKIGSRKGDKVDLELS